MNKLLENHLWLAILLTCGIIIIVRELSLILANWLTIPNMANIIGMLVLFSLLVVIRIFHALPTWLLTASNKILTESAFAYLPVSVGAAVLISSMGSELFGVSVVLLVSTILPLWGFAILGQKWLNPKSSANGKESSN